MAELSSLEEYLQKNKFSVQTSVTSAFKPYERQTCYPFKVDYGDNIWCLTGPLEGLPVEYHNMQEKPITSAIYIARPYVIEKHENMWFIETIQKLDDRVFFYSKHSQDIIDFIKQYRIMLDLNEYQSNLYWIMDAYFNNI